MYNWIELISFCCTVAAAQQPALAPSEPLVFRTGTRLVQVDVVVRDKSGPVKGLVKEDFTIFDQGRQQPITIFRDAAAAISGPIVSPGSSQRSAAPPLAAGAVSNRLDSLGKPLENATVLLLDQLNTVWDNSAYNKSWTLKYLRSLGANERIAVYMLGSRLGVVQDFTDDPGKLAQTVAKWDPKVGPLGVHWMDNADKIDLAMESMTAWVYAAKRRQITEEAIARIAGHLSGIPARRSLVWLAETPQLDAVTLAPLRAANIALYPVLVRGAPDFTDHHLLGVPDPHRDETPSTRDRALQAVAASTGGVAFTDSRDIGVAMRRAEEDAVSVYTLGYFPAEETLDGKFHQIKVVASGNGVAAGTQRLELRYRSGYIASRTLAPPQAGTAVADLLRIPLNATGIGLTAVASADSAHPGEYTVSVSVDLQDVRLEHSEAMATGALDLTFLDSASGEVRSSVVRIQVPNHELAATLEHGFPISLNVREFQGPEMVVVAADKATGLTGSLHFSLRK